VDAMILRPGAQCAALSRGELPTCGRAGDPSPLPAAMTG
jgi:hypothetical protein